jgi:FolB domain-containing protein
MSKPLDIVAVEDIEVDTIIGIYPQERVKPQRLRLNVAAYLTPRAAGTPHLTSSIDYARLTGDLLFILEHAHFELLESALEALATHCLGAPTADTPRAQVERVRLTLEKPFALGGHGVPKLTIERELDEPAVMREPVQVIFEGEGCGIYRFVVAPGASAAFVVPAKAVVHDFMLGAGLLANGEKLARGEMHTIEGGFGLVYDNPTRTVQTVLRISRPAERPDPSRAADLGSAIKRPPTGRRPYYPGGND